MKISSLEPEFLINVYWNCSLLKIGEWKSVPCNRKSLISRLYCTHLMYGIGRNMLHVGHVPMIPSLASLTGACYPRHTNGSNIERKFTVKSLDIFVYFIGRAIHEFKIPMIICSLKWKIIWNPQIQMPMNMRIVVNHKI